MELYRDLSPQYYKMLNNLLNYDIINPIAYPGLTEFFKGKRILITGAAGSIGSELSRQIVKLNPQAMGLLDINESGLADLLLEIGQCSDIKPEIFLTDISRIKLLAGVFEEFRPDVIYHTAAYKHVPVMESFPEAAIYVNIIGTFNLVKLAGRINAEKFIFISTDKAVNPVCIMGKSKKIAEEIIKRIRFNSNTNYITVRLGNILGSRGSVTEIFRKQIINGSPVTLTEYAMKRFFMTVEQALKLILKATITGRDSDLFIPDLQAVYIIDLIKVLAEKYTAPDKRDIRIDIIGKRKGEKFEEDLMTASESYSAQYSDGYYLINTEGRPSDVAQALDTFMNYKSKTLESIYSILKSRETNTVVDDVLH